MTKYIIREMQLKDTDSVRQLWTDIKFVNAFKWSPELYHKVFDCGVMVVDNQSTGKIIGACVGVNVSKKLGFIGGYGVLPEYRGQGIGQSLWNRTMANMGDRNVGLFAVSDTMGNIYKTKCEFSVVPNRRLIHMTGKILVTDDVVKHIDGITLCPLNEEVLTKVAKYDTEVTEGLDRKDYIEELCKSPDTWNLVAINENRDVVGYCVLYITVTELTMCGPVNAVFCYLKNGKKTFCTIRGIQTKSLLVLQRDWDSTFIGKDLLFSTKRTFMVSQKSNTVCPTYMFIHFDFYN
ncbi:uncharacterized protein F36G3.2-like [Oppia nitens]|uniref:uncharacterized protein F36G3.2-like n=1 Tax=Oppia nitens TaxID=1686743 RepID=UPI0023DBF68D|nr:uncharacterized protein F36G3.2-like [Oppia nitens]